MPKAWDIHKAELVQLYITEGRTLNDVQTILRRRHGFKASLVQYSHFNFLRSSTDNSTQNSRISYED
jgi:hypothetical protein